MDLTKLKIPFLKDLIYIGVIIAICSFLMIKCDADKKHVDKIIEANNLANALKDSVKTHKDRNGNLVSEKLTMQTTISNLQSMNDKLSKDKQTLLKDMKESNDKKDIISAGLIDEKIKISPVTVNADVITDSTVSFTENTDSLKFDILITGVRKINPIYKPQLKLKSLTIPNSQLYVEFYWTDNKKIGNPVSFKVLSKSKNLEIQNIESFIIPNATKETLNPTLGEKINKFTKKGSSKVLIIGGAVLTGFIIGTLNAHK